VTNLPHVAYGYHKGKYFFTHKVIDRMEGIGTYMANKLKVGIVGGTGMVGQRFVQLLDNHPWFEVAAIAASAGSAGKTYEEAVQGRWKLDSPIPDAVKPIVVLDASKVEEVAGGVDFVFCAVDMPKKDIQVLEEAYAKTGTPVISNNSAHRWTPDVPMVIPEINPQHIDVIVAQRKRLGTKSGFIAVKPNCSIQSYVPALHALMDYEPTQVVVSTYQAISGAGKSFGDWPEMLDNVIPYIGGEEEKSEQEPLRIWGRVVGDEIVKAQGPAITSQCIRVPVSDGHLATVFVSFKRKPSQEEILQQWRQYKGRPQELELPSAPKQFITYFEEENRPQTKLDRDLEHGMGVSMGRLREDSLYDYKFVGLSHNTLRGAAGGAVLIAELLKAEGYIQAK
jgi:aspartate-semialdehyde dehydrogenase